MEVGLFATGNQYFFLYVSLTFPLNVRIYFLEVGNTKLRGIMEVGLFATGNQYFFLYVSLTFPINVRIYFLEVGNTKLRGKMEVVFFCNRLLEVL